MSNIPPDVTPQKEQTETYRELNGDRIEWTWKNMDKDGSSSLTVMTYPIQGGAAKVQKKDTSSSCIQTKLSPDGWIATVLRDGKQYMTSGLQQWN